MKSLKIKEAFFNLKKSKPLSEESNDFLVKKGNHLHLIILATVGIMSLLYVAFDFAKHNYLQATLSATIIPSLFISYWLFQKNKTLLSKVWNLVHVSLIIGIQYLLQPPLSLALFLYLPVLLATLIVFQGKDKKLGALFAVCIVLIAIVLLYIGDHFRFDLYVRHESLYNLRVLNMSGSIIVTILEVIYLLRMNNSIQLELIEKNEAINRSNTILASTIKTRDKMLSIVSHDLRSPLILINSGLELIENDEFPIEKKKKLTSDLRKRSQFTLSLIDNMLLWTRSQTDQINFNPTAVPTASFKKIVEGFAETHIGDKGIELNYHAPDEGFVQADSDMIEGLLRNLISNSVKFTPPGGSISIQIIPLESTWRFVIQDSGTGISPDIIQKILNNDSISTPGTNKEKGHGIGMLVVQDFIKKHGSELKIESEQGKGTTFSFELNKA
jgi:signal transduction histidine kinase